MMCWDGLTVEQAARIGCGIGVFACAVVLLVVGVGMTWAAVRGGEGGAGAGGEGGA